MGGVTEVEEAVDAAFDDLAALGVLAKVVVRRYGKGLGDASTRTGVQGRLPVGTPVEADAILAPGKNERPARIYLRPTATGAAQLAEGRPEDAWTIQEPGGEEVEVTGSFERFGPQAGSTALWRATLDTGKAMPPGGAGA